MASLAFVYSIALVSRAPFILLDEVDAFLDVKNLVRMRRLL
jgi:chromosome segregation ATPase